MKMVNPAASLVILQLSLVNAAFVEAAACLFLLLEIPKGKITYYQLLLSTCKGIKSAHCLSHSPPVNIKKNHWLRKTLASGFLGNPNRIFKLIKIINNRIVLSNLHGVCVSPFFLHQGLFI